MTIRSIRPEWESEFLSCRKESSVAQSRMATNSEDKKSASDQPCHLDGVAKWSDCVMDDCEEVPPESVHIANEKALNPIDRAAQGLASVSAVFPKGGAPAGYHMGKGGAMFRQAVAGQSVTATVQTVLDRSVYDILHFTVSFLEELSLHRAPFIRDAPKEFKDSVRATHDAALHLLNDYTTSQPARRRGPQQTVPLSDFATKRNRRHQQGMGSKKS